MDIVLKYSAVYRPSIHSKLIFGNKFLHGIIWPTNFCYGQLSTPLLTIQLKSKMQWLHNNYECSTDCVHTAVSAMQIVYSRREKKVDSKINFIICSMIGTEANGTKNFYGINWHLLDFLLFLPSLFSYQKSINDTLWPFVMFTHFAASAEVSRECHKFY